MKKNRQEKLLELITRYEIDTQDELIARLREHGYDVTQATVSRDIRELNISKMTTGKGKYRYCVPKYTTPATGMKFSTALIDSIISVENACNLVVIKTYPGLANAVAIGIDRMNLPQILGCVAGDDTILMATRDAESASLVSDRLHDLLRNV
ncbi:MAG: arginine repressor [Clostridia bacterium]|nr:arginine repressor [Clostridia bacterium]MBR2926309.1 arginine repressor [Clostridia bacterium]